VVVIEVNDCFELSIVAKILKGRFGKSIVAMKRHWLL
jgi:hypothetical protein